jgi:uncharacterized protein (TIGR02996 family)
MTDQDFIDAILAEPDDDAPRLIYADWLEERGDPRAEFIRVQVELAAMAQPIERKSLYGNPAPEPRNRKDAARLRTLWVRQAELLTRHCSKWVEPLVDEARGVIFERGFVEGISIHPETFAKSASLWYRTMPIRQLRIGSPSSMPDDDWLSPLLGSPHLLNIRTLEMVWRVGPVQIMALEKCPYVRNLRELFLGQYHLSDELRYRFRQSPNLKNLRI